jgi:hypothetical protein
VISVRLCFDYVDVVRQNHERWGGVRAQLRLLRIAKRKILERRYIYIIEICNHLDNFSLNLG